MTAEISARDLRTLALGACAVVGLIALARGLPAARRWDAGVHARAASAAGEVASARADAAQLPTLRSALRDARDRADALDSSLIAGETPDAASAALAAEVRRIADSCAMQVSAFRLRADSTAVNHIAHVGVRINGTADVRGVLGFLRRVEGGETPLVIKDLSITSPDPIGAPGEPEQLRFDILVETVARVDPGARR
jgi:hypothetical protein